MGHHEPNLGNQLDFWDSGTLDDSKKLATASDVRLLRALAKEPVLEVLDDLVEGAKTQAELLTRFFDGKSAKASEALAPVESIGVIARPGGKKQPYVLSHPEETKALLIAAAELAYALSEAQLRADRDQAERRREWDSPSGS